MTKSQLLRSLEIGQTTIVELNGLTPKNAQIGLHSIARDIRKCKKKPIPSFKISAIIDEDSVGQKFIKVKRLA